MKRSRFMKRFAAYLLTICMVISTLCITDIHIVEAATDSTTVYFYNSDQWQNVKVHAWNETNTNLLGDWPGASAVRAEEIGSNWVKVEVPSPKPFNVIISDGGSENVRMTTYISDDKVFLINQNDRNFATAAEAERQVNGSGSTTNSNVTTVYFDNQEGWPQVGAYVYNAEGNFGDHGEALGGFNNTLAVAAPEVGEKWYNVDVPASPTFNIIFYNKSNDQQRAELLIPDTAHVYVTPDGMAHTSSSDDVLSVTKVYFLNNLGWEKVNAYAYDEHEKQLLGEWPGKEATVSNDFGGDWYEIAVPANPKFNIIFFNAAAGADTIKERAELQITDQNIVYVTGSSELYNSKSVAEIAVGKGDPSEMSVAYFYNSRGWKKVNGYTFTKEAGKVDDPNAEGVTLGAGWPGKETVSAAEEVGNNWWKITIPWVATRENPVFVIFNDGVNQTKDIRLNAQNGNYIIPTSELFTSKEAAEEAAENAVYDDDFGDAANGDVNSYAIKYGGAGAALPFTAYEAEAAETNAEVLAKNTTYSGQIQSEASGRQAVKLSATSDYVEFTLTEAANAMVLRYCIPDSNDGAGINAGLNVYVNGEKDSTLNLTSKYEWVYGKYPYFNTPSEGKPHRFFDEVRVLFGKTLPAGTKLKLQKDADNTAEYYIVDMVECEVAAAALTQPEGSLSVTDSEFGAIANDNQDDYNAFVKCIQKASETGKEVWIPAGTFDLKERKALEVNNITLRGAGMWYSDLVGEGAAFKFSGTSKFYDFAMTGMATVRRDAEDLAGFEPTGLAYNSTIQNIWMEHMKVGVWSSNTTNLVIQGCRIRNTYADGINLCSLTNGATVRNNHLRNTGDDCIAIWPWLGDCADNTISHNTVQLPNLANGIATYGGENNTVEYNYVADIVNNGSGICIGSDYDIANGYHGTTTVNGNVLARCGSYQMDYEYPVGAIWVWATKNPMTATFEIKNNTLYDCSYEAFLIDGYNAVSGVTFTKNQVDGATDCILLRGNGSNGTATVEDLAIANRKGNLVVDESNGAVQLTYKGKGIYEVEQIEAPVEEVVYFVTFDANGGSEVPVQTVLAGTAAAKPTDPTRDGYVFDGWKIGTEKFDFNTVITENIVLTAGWVEVMTPSNDEKQDDDQTQNDQKQNDQKQEDQQQNGWYAQQNQQRGEHEEE